MIGSFLIIWKTSYGNFPKTTIHLVLSVRIRRVHEAMWKVISPGKLSSGKVNLAMSLTDHDGNVFNNCDTGTITVHGSGNVLNECSHLTVYGSDNVLNECSHTMVRGDDKVFNGNGPGKKRGRKAGISSNGGTGITQTINVGNVTQDINGGNMVFSNVQNVYGTFGTALRGTTKSATGNIIDLCDGFRTSGLSFRGESSIQATSLGVYARLEGRLPREGEVYHIDNITIRPDQVTYGDGTVEYINENAKRFALQKNGESYTVNWD